MTRWLWPGLFAVLLLATGVAPVRADVPSYPWLKSKTQDRVPNVVPTPDPVPEGTTPPPAPTPPISPPTKLDPATGLPMRVPRDPPPPMPQRTGLFRSCGSGAGVGLVGIGAAWAMLWVGNRFAGRVARRTKNGPMG